LNPNYLDILTEQGSLTDLFTLLMGNTPKLTCLSQGRGPIDRIESHILGLRPRIFAHIREITMGTENANWLFARTVIPMETLTGTAKRLKHINNTPLGKVLFGSLNADRSQMHVELTTAEEVGLELPNVDKDFPLWQRQSIFELDYGPLLISEVLLPDCPIYDITP
jgi:chorismate--pyruvate lyase